MKREIKFRVFDSISKILHNWESIKHIPIPDFDLEHYILLQYTGLKDKNGIEIYEGDILRYSNRDNHHTVFSKEYVVEFIKQDLGSHSYQQTMGWNVTPIRQYEKYLYGTNGILDLFGAHKVEVIGNIHENKDLLKF